jgi:hypothetical protein
MTERSLGVLVFARRSPAFDTKKKSAKPIIFVVLRFNNKNAQLLIFFSS